MSGFSANLSGIRVGVRLLEGAEGGASVCHDILRDFLSPESHPQAVLSIRRFRVPEKHIPGWPKAGDALLESRLPDCRVLAWLREQGFFQGEFPLSDRTTCSYCLGALHLFDPLTSAGHAFLLEQGPGCFRPLHRLLWMYFAQVLGEAGGSFLHGAALEREGSGYLFLGDSGAGKTTLAEMFSEGVVFSDDGPILLGNGGGHRLCPSPVHQMWRRNARRWESMPEPVPLAGLFFLKKDEETFLEAVNRKEAFSRIICRHIHFLQYLTKEARVRVFDLLLEATRRVPAYDLHFTRQGDVWNVLRDIPGGGVT